MIRSVEELTRNVIGSTGYQLFVGMFIILCVALMPRGVRGFTVHSAAKSRGKKRLPRNPGRAVRRMTNEHRAVTVKDISVHFGGSRPFRTSTPRSTLVSSGPDRSERRGQDHVGQRDNQLRQDRGRGRFPGRPQDYRHESRQDRVPRRGAHLPDPKTPVGITCASFWTPRSALPKTRSGILTSGVRRRSPCFAAWTAFLDSDCGSLTLPMLRRVEIARALSCGPCVIFLDRSWPAWARTISRELSSSSGRSIKSGSASCSSSTL